MMLKSDRLVLMHEVVSFHGVEGSAQRGYSENAASFSGAAGDGSAHSGVRSVPSTSAGGGKPASAATVG